MYDDENVTGDDMLPEEEDEEMEFSPEDELGGEEGMDDEEDAGYERDLN